MQTKDKKNLQHTFSTSLGNWTLLLTMNLPLPTISILPIDVPTPAASKPTPNPSSTELLYAVCVRMLSRLGIFLKCLDPVQGTQTLLHINTSVKRDCISIRCRIDEIIRSGIVSDLPDQFGYPIDQTRLNLNNKYHPFETFIQL